MDIISSGMLSMYLYINENHKISLMLSNRSLTSNSHLNRFSFASLIRFSHMSALSSEKNWKYGPFSEDIKKENDTATYARGTKLPTKSSPFNVKRYNAFMANMYDLIKALKQKATADGDREAVALAAMIEDDIATSSGNHNYDDDLGSTDQKDKDQKDKDQKDKDQKDNQQETPKEEDYYVHCYSNGVLFGVLLHSNNKDEADAYCNAKNKENIDSRLTYKVMSSLA
jgi:hypothetical protein